MLDNSYLIQSEEMTWILICFLILMYREKWVGTIIIMDWIGLYLKIILRYNPGRHVQITSNFHFLIAT